MASRTLFFRRENANGPQPAECWYLVRQSDGSYWVEYTHEPATGDAETISMVRVGRFFAHTEDQELLGRLRAVLRHR